MIPAKDGYPRRSMLFVPAVTASGEPNVHVANGAAKTAADVIIIDMEDGVPSNFKKEARSGTLAILDQVDFSGKKVIVRVNSLKTEWGKDDLDIIKGHPKIDAVFVPKVEDKQELLDTKQLTEGKPIWAIMETAKGVFNIRYIMDGSGLVEALVFGTNDFSADIGVTPDNREALRHARNEVLLAARANNCMAFDGPSPKLLENEEEIGIFSGDCSENRLQGFDGKVAIHPRQLSIINRTFSPTEAELERAQKIVTEFDARYPDGVMAPMKIAGVGVVEPAHYQQALGLMAMARNIESKSKGSGVVL